MGTSSGQAQPPPGPHSVAAYVMSMMMWFRMAHLIVCFLYAAARAALRGDAHRLLTFMLLIRANAQQPKEK